MGFFDGVPRSLQGRLAGVTGGAALGTLQMTFPGFLESSRTRAYAAGSDTSVIGVSYYRGVGGYG